MKPNQPEYQSFSRYLAPGLILIPALFMLLLCGALADPGVPPDHPTKLQFPEVEFHPRKPERIVCDNGMVVYFLADPSAPLLRMRGMIHAGSLCESSPETGLASLTASMLRLGGSTLTSATEMNRTLEYVGATLETSGSRDTANISLSVLPKDQDLGIRLMAEILRHPAFPEDKLRQRKAEVFDELRRQQDDPMEITRKEFRKLVFGDHPYGRDLLGTVETLNTFQPADLQRWHQTWYHPDRMILCVAGDFELTELQGLLEKYLGDWQRGNKPVSYPSPQVTQAAGKRYFIAKELNQSTVRIGHLAVAWNNPDRIPLEVLNFILGDGGFSSRLFQKVRNEGGYAYAVRSEFEESLLMGQFLAFLQTKAEKTVAATQLTGEIIRNLVEKGDVTEEELNLARQSKLNDFVFMFETPFDNALLHAQLEYYGLPADYLATFREKVAKVTVEDLRRVAKQYLRPEALTILILGNPSIQENLKDLGHFELISSP
jgi:predicted Zn-dependent peptidase